MTEPKTPSDIEALNYEEAREQLVQVVGKLEAGGASLEESLALWERGEALAAGLEEWRGAYENLVLAPRVLIEAVLPGMRERRWGRIVNVGSSATRMNTLCGSKSS